MRVVNTRATHQAAAFSKALQAMGAHPISFPTIDIQPLRDPVTLTTHLERLSDFDWAIFTSENAANAVRQTC